ncbi:MAG: DNA polymerase III subunit alpha, partial [Ruminococcus sp.]|nr:DNA polymerase III subunit alpha [Ruminococcus sp.]
MLSNGDTGGVFQFESAGMTQKLMELCPERLEDLIVVLSLYRPGPMKSIPVYIENKKHPDRISYKHPLLEPILADTYGVMVYQEQVMEICRRLAGYSYGHADIVRRAMAKKKHDVMLRERESFVAGARQNGVPAETADSVFDEMVSFASYAFNKSHAAAYAYLAYQTAYLKYHYRGLYMAALMSSVMSYTEKLAEYIDLCRTSGIEVLKPDVNKSMRGFTFSGGKMYFGLLAIKNAGSGLADRIIAERSANGDFRGLQDFCERIEGRELNKKALENMIKAGAFDGLGLNRRQMLENHEVILDMAGSGSRGVIEGQLDLLGGTDTSEMNMKIPYRQEFEFRRLLAMEKEATGMYLSGSPLTEFAYIASLMHTKRISSVLSGEPRDGEKVKLLCTVQSLKQHNTRNGDKMAFITVADDSGEIEAVVFPDLFAVSANRLRQDNILLLSGKISVKDDSVTVVCDSVFADTDFERMTGNMKLCIKTSSDKASVPDQLVRICEENRGTTQICFYLTDRKATVMPKKRLSLCVNEATFHALAECYDPAQIGLIH